MSDNKTNVHAMWNGLVSSVYLVTILNLFYRALKAAYEIRLHAITEYGRVIHEFDPYFNYRATEYLYEHGWAKFATWFDYMVWYPLGRPVGTTIYPGMQVTSVFIKHYILKDWSINDICVFVPAWFGVMATLLTGFLAYECSVGITVSSNSISRGKKNNNNNNNSHNDSLQQTYGLSRRERALPYTSTGRRKEEPMCQRTMPCCPLWLP